MSSVSCAWLYRSLLLLLILIINQAGTSSSYGGKQCAKTCGELHEVSYPFRLQSDPPGCGEPEFELVCEGGANAVLYIDSHKYLVTNLSYDLEGGLITLHVDCSFTTSACLLQHYSSHINFSVYWGSGFQVDSWASFINCSQRIENKAYMLVPSLSNQHAIVYATVGYDANRLFRLHESCRFINAFPFPYIEQGQTLNSSKQVINVLHKQGFELEWLWDGIGNQNCWTYAKKKSIYVYNFFDCLATKAFKKSYYLKLVSEIVLGTVLNLQLGLLARAVLYRFLVAPLFVCIFLIFNYRKNTKPMDNIEKFLQKQQVLAPRRYAYADIITMTRHFKEKLGIGGFGSVYKGELLGGHLVAVKVLNVSKFNGEEFINEVATIGRIHHVNIVQLVGFCSEGNKRALVYEYMPNGSLDKYIFASKENSKCPLTLDKLNDIALGIARGIHYLHTGCEMQILHFDIKPHNILLDHNFSPKISDFGLARLYPKKNDLVSVSAARGTIGYIAPELISRSFGVVSNKSDVYSFGMLLLEIAGRRKNVDVRVQNSSQVYYPSWIYDHLFSLNVPNLEDIVEIGELERKLYKVAFWCIQLNSAKRPSIGEVVDLLQVDVDNLQLAPKPFFSSIDDHTMASSNMPSYSMDLSIIIEHNV